MEHVVSTYRSIGVVFLIVLVGADGDLGQIPRYVREGGHPLFVLHTAGGKRKEGGRGEIKSLLMKSNLKLEGKQSEEICISRSRRDSSQVLCIFIDNKADKQRPRQRFVGVTATPPAGNLPLL